MDYGSWLFDYRQTQDAPDGKKWRDSYSTYSQARDRARVIAYSERANAVTPRDAD